MKRMICHGDSLTRGADLPGQKTWPALIALDLSVESINTGISGDTTGGMLSRFHFEVVQKKPDLVMITGGTNDFWWDLPTNGALANVFTMACQAEYYGILPVIGLPIPIFEERAARQDFMPPLCGYDRCIERLHDFSMELMIRAEAHHLPFIDFYHLFKDDKGKVIPSCYLDDGLHASEEGHRIMAKKAVRVLRTRFGFQ